MVILMNYSSKRKTLEVKNPFLTVLANRLLHDYWLSDVYQCET